MADDKKEKKGGGTDMFEELVMMLFVLFFVWLVFNRLADLVAAGRFQSIIGAGMTLRDIALYFLWPALKIFAALVALLAVIGIFHTNRKLVELNKEEKEIYSLMSVPPVDGYVPQPKNPKWERVIEHINSTDPSDWRMAIIEADIMLDELLTAMGYHGESIGDKLKSVERSDFVTIENAWEAHKTRNRIAHQGGDFPLNEREAKQAVALFESVFQEFKII